MLNLIALLICLIQPTEGVASYYTRASSGTITASGEKMNDNLLTCAMKKVPLGSYVLVLNEENLKCVVCRVNDRGPHIKGRIIDLSKAAIRKLHPTSGLLNVRVFRLL
jgi:rare lipoprotein A